MLLHLQGGGEGGHQPGLWDLLFSGWREERQYNGGELSALCIFFFQIIKLEIPTQARDENPEYDDYDYMESNMDNAVRDNNPQYAVC